MARNIGFLQNADREAALDKEAILADMDAIADEIGDWKDHIPYEAAIEIYSDDAVREMYSEHLDGCQYCQEMVETLNPSEKILGNLHHIREEEAVWSQPREKQSWGWSINPSIPIAASIGLGLFAGMFVDNPFEDSMLAEERVVVIESAGTDRGTSGLYLENQSLEGLFLAARLNLENGSDRLAYAQMASGFDVAGLDQRFVNAVNVGPAFMDGSNSEEEILNALAELGKKKAMVPEDVLEAIKLNASIGNDRDATESMARYLEMYSDQPRTLEAFEALVLQRPEE